MADCSTIQNILQSHLDRLLQSREYPKTICPSEVARSLTANDLREAGMGSWRDTMTEIRRLAAAMRSRREIEVLQRGIVLDGELGDNLETVVGPIRLRKPSSKPA
ncbi:uncharacterized protein LY89DRAFT_587342 [Mollisia scopiformis]|uniref:Uncharacterized protein n=1 Tax=Mollisia scopiformis TaxID=149040 RepID=A0A194X6V6_MOLSC|nr:uncharacterized protein LY89DRAFT_587342 [Mollisia scopiformis]KUJ15814.1 hypothetical protein LY89DRAFT_587342 [Mollisia scopiformis]